MANLHTLGHSLPILNRSNARNRIEVLSDEMDCEHAEEIIVTCDCNVTAFKSNKQKEKVQLKILYKSDLEIYEYEGIQMENITSSKPNIFHVRTIEVTISKTTRVRN